MIYEFSERTFKISGHGLLLTMTTSLLYFEGHLNFYLVGSKKIKNICTALIFVNFYVMFWTSLAYHSLIEVTIGLGLGLVSSYFVYTRFNR